MAHILRPLSLGQLLDETFNIYRRNFLLFIGISAIPNLILLAVQLALGSFAVSQSTDIALAAFVGLGSVLAALFVNAAVVAATTFGVSDIYLETPTSIMACFSRVSGKALRVIYVSFITSLMIGIGLAFCIVPGIYLAGRYGLAVPAVVLEKITGNRSLSRSADLTQDFIGRVILVYFLTTIFTMIMAVSLGAVTRMLGTLAFHDSGIFTRQAFETILNSIGEIIFGPVTAIALTLAYYDLRVRKEAFDIEHMMSLMNPQDNLASGTTAS
jgi:hypothetical protein